VEKIRQVLTGFIQFHGYVCRAALLWLHSPVLIAFSQKKISISPSSTAAETEGYARQHAGGHHAPAPQTPLKTEHYVVRNKNKSNQGDK